MQLTAEIVTVHTRHPFIIARGGTSEFQVVWVRVRDALNMKREHFGQVTLMR